MGDLRVCDVIVREGLVGMSESLLSDSHSFSLTCCLSSPSPIYIYICKHRLKHEEQSREKEAQYYRQMAEAKEDYDAELRHLEQAVRDMEGKAEFEHQRYLNRESRPEDVATIHELQASLAHAEMMRQRAVVGCRICMYYRKERLC